MMSKISSRFIVATLALCGIVVSGCHVDMWRQPYVKPYEESRFYPDKQANRPVVEGTVAQGGLRLNDALYTGYANGKEVKTIPQSVVRTFASPKEMLVRGQDRYQAYCYPCHGSNGNGNGFISIRGKGYWQKMPASYHTARLQKASDGYLYDVIVNGHGVMYGYASRIQDVNDRWAIVAYIRALQYSRNRPTSEVSPSALQNIGKENQEHGAEEHGDATHGAKSNDADKVNAESGGVDTNPRTPNDAKHGGDN